MSVLKFTPLDEIDKVHTALFATFRAGTCRPLAWRRAQLHQFARMVQDNAPAWAAAIHADLGKPAQEAYMAEIGPLVERGLRTAELFDVWAAPEHPAVPDWQQPWAPTVHKVPKGPVLIIAPWNYPMILSLQALIAAIAAGCPAVVKPSELAPAYSQLLAATLPQYLDTRAFRVVLGAAPEATRLLTHRWAHIFYTGNARVARIIAAAAAKHLTPVSLELGGKSPVVLDPAFDVALAARRILFGKTQNAGQLCVAPDYVLVCREQEQALITALGATLAEFFPDGALRSDSFTHIVSPAHHARLTGLLARTRGRVVFGGSAAGTRVLEPTVVAGVEDGDALLEDEIFGPILPLVAVDSLDDAIAFVNARESPLSFYVFTEDPAVKQRFIDETLSGGIVFNDTFQQLAVSELPFSGVGESGYGTQILKYGFDGFTHLRASIDMPILAEPHLAVRYPPYTDASLRVLSASVHLPIPSTPANGTAQTNGHAPAKSPELENGTAHA